MEILRLAQRYNNISVLKHFGIELERELRKLTREIGKETTDNLVRDGRMFLLKNRGFLTRGTIQLTLGHINFTDFVREMRTKKKLADMQSSRQQGHSEARIDELREVLLKLMIGTMVKLTAGGNLIKTR